MKKPTYAPVYAAIYPGLAEICQRHGYALAVHGSLARDFDLIAIPWIAEVSTPKDVISEITATFHLKQIGKCDIKQHGRTAYTISIGHGECALDLSFLPPSE